MSIIEQLFIDTLRRTQWLPPARIAAYQGSLLENLLRHAASQTEFNRDRLRPLFATADIATAPIDFSRWAEVPIATRADVLDNFEAMKALSVPPETGAVVSGQSSGSTGEPMKHLRSQFADDAANCQLDRVFELFDFDLFGTLAWITFDAEELFPYPHGRKFNTWNRTAENADFHVLDIRTHPADQLEWLLRVRPDYLFSYANNLKAIADLIPDAQGSALRLKSIISTGEILTADTRKSIEQVFGCRVIDIYGAREIGQIAFQCPSADRYHLCSELVLTEIVDGNGIPVRPGELGRIVVTPLYNYAMPFIRYHIGDYAIASSSPCACGRGLPCLDQIVGRTRNLFVMPDGSKKWPAMSAEMARLLPYRQFQMVQLDPFTLEFRYVPASAGEPADPSGLISYLRAMFHQDLKVRVVAVDAVERTPGGKFEMFMSRVGT